MVYPFDNMTLLEALFPKVRCEILRLLFAHPEQELHLRELARQGGLTVGTIQQEVAKLTSADLLTPRRDGNRLYYRANKDHPIFPELQSLILKTVGLREPILAALSGLPDIELAFVFGSVANGEARSDSDLDLLILGKIGLRTLAPRLRELSSTLGREINPLVISRQSLAEKASRGDAFITNLLASPKIWIIGSSDELGVLV